MMRGSFVYFARDPATGRIKIGSSGSIDRRIATLRREFPGLVVLATTPGGRYVEDSVHAALFDHHLGHEWFEASPRVEAFVIAVAEGWIKPAQFPKAISPIRSAAAQRGWACRRERYGVIGTRRSLRIAQDAAA